MRLPTLVLPAAPFILGLLGSLVVAALRSTLRSVPIPVRVRSSAPLRRQS